MVDFRIGQRLDAQNWFRFLRKKAFPGLRAHDEADSGNIGVLLGAAVVSKVNFCYLCIACDITASITSIQCIERSGRAPRHEVK